MPALITHHLFGEHSAVELPDGIIQGQEELLAFLLGNQGPDPFFFRFSSVPDNVAACHRFAHVMHEGHVTAAFEALRDGVSHLPADDERIGRSFALGVLSHYQLDRTTHPLIFAEEYATLDASPDLDLDTAGGEVHAVIEGEIDSWMLWRERHATVLECPPARELCRTQRIDRVAGALMAQVALAVFDLDLGADEYGACVRNMEFVYRAIEPAGSRRAEAVGAIERNFRTHSQIEAMAHKVVTSDSCTFANEGHHEWRNPFAPELSCASFTDLFDEALAGWPTLSEAFVRGDGLGEACAGLNYSGSATGEDD
ncbi:MAG: zinc dependent phospholipase C family protein [Atopobiaceae bacterium]|jgi:hypothetical protein|nr:zinc dependent phospholipase C family protein [Atopobiaceae bacterium]MCI2173462.1 zinc dependent phospholipase C family protein [Atopobiaceae bacterium]MCI2207457.1 zinc dependent phospholipase C family protein [Atopobiaceae bacterium]